MSKPGLYQSGREAAESLAIVVALALGLMGLAGVGIWLVLWWLL